MRRLAYALAAVLAVAVAPSARAEPLDFDLARLGAPTAETWAGLAGTTTVGAQQRLLAADARRRFGMLASQLGLALSSAVLQPASTTGHSGFAVDLEIATVPASGGEYGTPAPPNLEPQRRVWPAKAGAGTQLYLPSVHFRKALPFSLEFGGRLIYLNQSSYYAAQGEAKWSFTEGLDKVPEVAARVAYTRMFGHRDLSLGATEGDLMISKRFGLNGVSSLTPYGAFRYTWVTASSDRLEFSPNDPQPATVANDRNATQASFPRFTAGFLRATLGLRYTVFAVALGLEGTYSPGGTKTSGEYEGVEVASSFSGAAKLGWEF